MKTKQILALLLALLTVLAAFASCTVTPSQETEKPGVETSPTTPGSDDETEVTCDLPADLNFSSANNPTITFFVRDGYVGEIYVEELLEEDLNDAIYWRNQAVKEALGIEIAQISQACGWSKSGHYSDWNNTLRNAIQTTTHDFDAAMIYAGTGSSLAIEGCYMDLTELDMISLEKPWWTQSLLEAATVYNSLYFAAGSITYSQLTDANVLYYNKDLYNEYFAASEYKSLYDVVRDGEWTIDYMGELVAQVWEDADSNGEHSSGDTMGFTGSANSANGSMDAWFYSLGCNLTVMDESIGEPVAAFYNEHTIQAYEKLTDLYTNNEGSWCLTSTNESHGETSFGNGKVMMMQGCFSSGNGLREATFAYGVLPVPKFDLDQENYVAIPEVTSSMVTVLSTVESDRLDMVTATIEMMAYQSYKEVIPAYIEVVLKSKQANSPEDAEMAQLIIDSLVYSFGWIFSSTHMADMGKAFRTMGSDMTNYYETRKDKYEQMINDLIDGFASLA